MTCHSLILCLVCEGVQAGLGVTEGIERGQGLLAGSAVKLAFQDPLGEKKPFASSFPISCLGAQQRT